MVGLVCLVDSDGEEARIALVSERGGVYRCGTPPSLGLLWIGREGSFHVRFLDVSVKN